MTNYEYMLVAIFPKVGRYTLFFRKHNVYILYLSIQYMYFLLERKTYRKTIQIKVLGIGSNFFFLYI